MASADTNIIDTHLTLMPTTKLELGLGWRNREQMHITRIVLVERHGLQQDVVVRHLRRVVR